MIFVSLYPRECHCGKVPVVPLDPSQTEEKFWGVFSFIWGAAPSSEKKTHARNNMEVKKGIRKRFAAVVITLVLIALRSGKVQKNIIGSIVQTDYFAKDEIPLLLDVNQTAKHDDQAPTYSYSIFILFIFGKIS